jgi:hypothetical protein
MTASVALADIIDVVCEHFRCSQIDLRSQRRTAKIVEPRQIAMYLAAKITEKSLPQIGNALGGRDHTTVLHGVRKVELMLARDAYTPLAHTVFALEAAALALAELRGRGVLPEPEEEIAPIDLARRVYAGGRNAAMRLPADRILELADALIAAEEEREMLARGIAPAPLFVEAPSGLLFDIVHDFVGAEAMLRSHPSINLRAVRDAAVEQMRLRAGESGAVDAAVAAYDAMRKGEFTAAERDATERYRHAVKALANEFLKTQEIASNV